MLELESHVEKASKLLYSDNIIVTTQAEEKPKTPNYFESYQIVYISTLSFSYFNSIATLGYLHFYCIPRQFCFEIHILCFSLLRLLLSLLIKLVHLRSRAIIINSYLRYGSR